MGLLWFMTRMPGKSYKGELPAATAAQQELTRELQRDLEHLAVRIGERNVTRRPQALEQAATWIEAELQSAGYAIEPQEYEVAGEKCRNIIVEIKGGAAAKEIVVVGAHYDTVPGSPGANDNGSGVVSLLAMARRLAGAQPARTLRMAFFVNEEPPWFQHEEMGSLVYARSCHQRKDRIVAMLSLETMGYFSSEPGSQAYPIVLLKAMLPTTGNYIGFVGSTKSGALVRRSVELFRKHSQFPSEGGAIPGVVQGVGWSDHWAFEQHGYPAIMVTDTAPFRYPHYHTAEDTPDKVDFDKLARVTDGLLHVVEELVSGS